MPTPFDKLVGNTSRRKLSYNKFDYGGKNIIDPTKALNSGISFSSDITNVPAAKGNLSFKGGLFGTTTPSPTRSGQPIFNPLMAGTLQNRPVNLTASPTGASAPTPGVSKSQQDRLAELQRQATTNNALYESLQTPTAEISGASAPGTSGATSGASGGSGSTGPGAGGYTPPGGLTPIEEGVDVGIPEPSTAEDQPFTQTQGAGTIGGGSTGSLAGGAPPSKYQQGFNQSLAVMGAGAAGNVSGAQGTSLVNQYSPSARNDASSLFVKSDPFINSLVTAWQDYINPQNQRVSLTDTYNQMIKDSGIQAIDTELLDMKNVIEGSQDDIRTEITKAGGFATESQVLAMTNARNKQLIKNYNTLLDTRNAKEKYLQTAIGLEQADRESADQRFESAFSMGTQLATMQQQMQQNARSQMQWLASNVGFDGLYDSTNGDPFSIGLIEQSLGLPQGGLLTAANRAQLARLQAEEERQLGLQEQKLGMELKREQIATERKQRSLLGQPKTEIVDVGGRKFLVNSQTGNVIKEIAGGGTMADDQKKLGSLDMINTLESVQNSKGLNNAVGPSFFKWVARMATPGGAKQAFIGDVQNIVDNMSLEKLIKAKAEGATFGALSDNELRMLGSAATKVGTWSKKNSNGEVVGYNVSEKAFRSELDRISALTKRAYVLSGYAPEDVGAKVEPDGSITVKNYDGSVTEIKPAR